MKLNVEKIREIYGDSIVFELKDNMDNLVDNLNFLISKKIEDPYDVVETNPYLFLQSPETFQEKINSLIERLGVEYVEKLSEDSSLWGD